MTLKEIYRQQLEYVKSIAEDIRKNNCSKDVIEYATNYTQIENAYGDFWRVNFGEVYAYIDIDENGKPSGTTTWYNMDEIGCYEPTYIELIKELDGKSEEELASTQYAWCYDDFILGREEYRLEYKVFKK